MDDVVSGVEYGQAGQGASTHAAAAGTGHGGKDAGGAHGVSRPSVMSLSIREKAALYAAYMRFVEGGGLFIPTTRPARLGDDIYAIVSLMEETSKVPIPGKVCWITPAGVPGRQQGIGVQFAKNEAGAEARRVIENLLSGALKSTRPTHTI